MIHKKEYTLVIVLLTAFLAVVGAGVAFLGKTGGSLTDLQLSDGKVLKAVYSKKDDLFKYYLPSYADMENVTFSKKSVRLSADGKTYSSGMNLAGTETGKKYTVEDVRSHKKQKIMFMKSENVPKALIVRQSRSSRAEHSSCSA